MVRRGGSDGGSSTVIQNVYSKLMRFTAYQFLHYRKAVINIPHIVKFYLTIILGITSLHQES